MSTVHITKGGANHGPFTIEEINSKLVTGELSTNDKAWFEGSSGWQELSSSQFVELGVQSAPPPPPAGPAGPPPPLPTEESPPPPIQPVNLVSNEDGMKKLEPVIELALADGVVTEKEREILYRKADEFGVPRDELDMILDAKTHLIKKESVDEVPSKAHGKCPACGAQIESFVTRCEYCGHEIKGVGVSGQLSRFKQELEDAEKQALVELKERKDEMDPFNRFFKNLGENMDNGNDSTQGIIRSKQIPVITNFLVPNSREDIVEFLILAKSQVGSLKVGLMEKMNEATHKKQAFKSAWKAKCEQVVAKARMSMSDDKTTLDMVEKLAKELKI